MIPPAHLIRPADIPGTHNCPLLLEDIPVAEILSGPQIVFHRKLLPSRLSPFSITYSCHGQH